MYSLALAFAPGLAICIFIYWKDKFEKEPAKLLALCFLLGILSTFPALFLEIAAKKYFSGTGETLLQTALFSFFGIAIIEEGCKYFFTRYTAYKTKAFNEPFDGITYSVMVSMGFASLENLFYILQGGYQVAFVRMVTAVPAHAAFGIIIGYYLGLQKMKGMKGIGIKGLLMASALHAAYDFFILANYVQGMWIGALVSLYIGVRFSLNAIKLHQQASPFRI